MIDTHCHILPGLDDGARTIDDALRMARMAVDDGITTVIATPHVSLKDSGLSATEISGAVTTLQEHLDASGIPLQVLHGAELELSGEILDATTIDRAFTVGGSGRYLLLEVQGFALPYRFAETLFTMKLHGLTPILAHPERIPAVVDNPRVLEKHVYSGLLLQVTTPSILGQYGAAVRRTAETLIRHRWVQLLASDAHNTHERTPTLAAAAARVQRWIGEMGMRALVSANCRRIVQGDDVPAAPSDENIPRKRRWLFT